MYELIPTTKFRRDVRRLHKRNYDLEKLIAAQDILIETGTLPERFKAHPLRGEYVGCIDAHIEPDWILIYEVLDANTITLRRTVTHAALFR